MFLPVEYAEYQWIPTIDLDKLDIWQKMELSKPYLAAVMHPIADEHPELPPGLISLFSSAVESAVRFDMLLEEKSVVMPSILLRSEASSSSQIEHLTASSKNIALAEIGESSEPNAVMVAGNISALIKALEKSDTVTRESITDIHRVLMEKADPEIAGNVRTSQVWIGGRGISPHSAVFVPPHHTNVENYLEDLIRFCNRTDIHGVLKAAIAHCQFETIHPFLDGNGRCGRALIQLMLHQSGLIRKGALPVSAGLLSNTHKYFSALETYRDGDYSPIVEMLCIAILDAVALGHEVLGKVEELRSGWTNTLKARNDAAVWRLLEFLFVQPVINVKTVSLRLGITDPAARNAIEQLLASGILKTMSNQKRGLLYEAHEITRMMDSFAAKLARRQQP